MSSGEADYLRANGQACSECGGRGRKSERFDGGARRFDCVACHGTGRVCTTRTVGRFDSPPWHATHKFKLIDQASGECEFCNATPGTDKARKECTKNPFALKSYEIGSGECTARVTATDDSEERARSYRECGCHTCTGKLAQPVCTTPTAPVVQKPEAPDMFPGDRKAYPVFTGLLLYFPDACAAVANCSHIANEQHNPGERVHWDRAKSIGEGNELLRHLMQAGTFDADGIRHTAKAAWRALELLQREIEAERK